MAMSIGQAMTAAKAMPGRGRFIGRVTKKEMKMTTTLMGTPEARVLVGSFLSRRKGTETK